MPQKPLSIQCYHCNEMSTKDLSIISPKEFSSSTAHTILYHGKCDACNQHLAFRYRCIENKKGELEPELQVMIKDIKIFHNLKYANKEDSENNE